MDRAGLVTDGWIPNLVAWSHAQPGERALVVADALNAAEGEQLAEALRAHGCETNTVLWDGDDRPWAQTPQRIVDAAQDVDVYVFLHMDVMGAEAAARFGLADPVTSRGGRALFLGFVDGELLRGELSLPQPDLGAVADDLLRTLVDGAGQGADVIAELGIGFNPTVTPRGHVMLDEKAGKTAHVAIGRNTGSYGGVNDAKIHVDCIFSLPEVEVDGRRLEVPS
jgi:hypothetical protein